MFSIRTISRPARVWVLLPLSLAGCAGPSGRFTLTSFKDPFVPRVLNESFPAGSFARDAHQDWNLVFRLHTRGAEAARIDPQATADPGVGTAPSDVIQLIHVKVFWMPRPGTTFAESSQTNATITYCLISGSQAISYEGAGFVYFEPSRDGATLTGQIESSTLAPRRSVDKGADILGPCRLTGSFSAVRDERAVASATLELQRRFDPRITTLARD